ncbi:MAG: glycoside hydrolase family 38 C-terminal domain-containing protein [Eubacteriales bacterium]|nr:glycoside hydrolase family 38 C-terminal domain-containing protein [Eubacteriales bacterium]
MNFYDKLKRLEGVCGTNYWSHRIGAEILYLASLSKTKDDIYNGRIEEALDYLGQKLDENHAITKPDALHVEQMLSDLSAEAKAIRVFCVSHAHIDMNWMWGYQETVSVTVDTFRTVLNLMKEYPDFTYAQSQASVYKIIETQAPEMIEEIKKYVHEGRWELSASTWVETDKNMPNGESLSRHILYTKRYLSKLFDVCPDSLRLDFEPDTFGHNANVPEILQKGGVDYYYHCRGYDGPNDIYRWQSPSGSEILVHRDPKWYNGQINIRSFTDIPLFCKKNNTDVYLHVYGVGDHGGGPTRRDIEAMIDNAAFPLYPTVEFGTYGKYFAELERFRSMLPVVKHELNYVFTGCYTSQSRIKMSNRLSEDRLYESEMFSAAANKLTGAPGKTELYAGAWENVLFNHFHDILPGSGIIETREHALGLFQKTLAAANTNANTAMRNIADGIDTSSIAFDESKNHTSEGGGVGFAVNHESGHAFPQAERGRGSVRVIHLFNSTMHDRKEAVEVTLWDYNYDLGRVVLTDAAGTEIPFQFTQTGAGYWGHNYTKLLVYADIPAFGYSTYIVKLRAYDAANAFASPSDARQDHISDDPLILENEFIKATFDPLTMAMTGLDDKTTRTSPVTPERPSALFRFIKENPRFGMTSWRVGPYMHVADLNSADFNVRVQDYRHEPLRSFLRYEIAFASSKLNVLAILKKGSKIVEFDVTVDWHEVGRPGNFIPQLNFYMPVGYASMGYKYDIPFGTIVRGDTAHDVPGNSFMQIMSGKEKSVFIVTDSKYGFRGSDNAGAVTLIRGSYDPDPYPEYGKHHFKLGVGICCDACLMKYTGEFCHPIAFNSGTKHSGGLPMSGSLFSLEGNNVKTSAVKNAEDGGLIVRLSEYNGQDEKVTLKLAFTPESASLVDITERHTVGECAVDGSEVSFTVPANSIATVLIK